MTIRSGRFAGEYAALADLTGDSVETLVADDGSTEPERWLAWDGSVAVGVLDGWHGDDGRLHLFLGPCAEAALASLVGAVPGPCHIAVDAAGRAAFAPLGFRPWRTEQTYSVPVAPLGVDTPAGVTIVGADRVDVDELRLLDDALRQDVPGSDGWRNDPARFAAGTLDSPYFDPDTYPVARHGDGLVGLARVWLGPRPTPRLGLVGALPAHRRRGVALALLDRVFTELAARGEPAVTAEVDTTNLAATALFRRLGAEVTGETYELRRP